MKPFKQKFTRLNIILTIFLFASIMLSIIKIAFATTPDPGHDFTTVDGGIAQGDILYGDATDSLSALAKNTTATRYVSNTGTSNNPAWAQVELSNGVTGYYPVDVQTFTNTGDNAWNKPSTGSTARIQIWAAGGSGGRAGAADGGGGGGGGGYVEAIVALSTLASAETCSVGTGGAAVTADNTDGNVGGNTTFDVFTAYGGGPGFGNTADDGGGGGGGGPTGVGTIGTNTAGGTGGGGATAGLHDFLGGGGGTTNGGNGGWGGGGGGFGQDTGTAYSGGKSYYGGGGGAGGDGAGAPEGSGGTSVFGGAGGAGATGANAATAGTQPGGGGGGSVTGNSGAGGNGKCVITVW